MEFLVQCICFIYTKLIVYATQILAYSKDYICYNSKTLEQINEKNLVLGLT